MFGLNNGFQNDTITSTNCFLSGKKWKPLKDGGKKKKKIFPPHPQLKPHFPSEKDIFFGTASFYQKPVRKRQRSTRRMVWAEVQKTICSSQSKVSLISGSTRKFEATIQSKIQKKNKDYDSDVTRVMSLILTQPCSYPSTESLCCLFIHPHNFPALELLLVLFLLLALPCFEKQKNYLSALGSQENPLEWGYSSLQEAVCPNPDISSSTVSFNKSDTLVLLSQLDPTPDILMTKFCWV